MNISELPESISKDLYLCYSPDYNEVTFSNWEPTGELVSLGKVSVHASLPSYEEIKEICKEALEKYKEETMAEHEVLMNRIQDNIESLLAIEYKPEDVETVDETSDEDSISL